MKDLILRLLEAYPKHPWNPREIAQRLHGTPRGRKELRNLLQSMSEEGLIQRHRGNRYTLLIKDKTLVGTLKVHPEGYGFVIPESSLEKDVFIPSRYLGTAMHQDQVIASYREKDDTGRREGKILKIVKRGQTHLVGKIEKKGKHFHAVCEDKRGGVNIWLQEPLMKSARAGVSVVVRILQYPMPGQTMKGEVVEVLGPAIDEKTESAAILVRHQIPRKFPALVLEEVDFYDDSILNDEAIHRVDLRDKPHLTIDGITARDFDDAVYVEKKGGYDHLYVSIADVAHYVPRDSLTDREAQTRGTSVYFPDFAIPMLPEKLSNDLCSLKAGKERLALTVEIKLDSVGLPLEAWYYESLIKSVKRGIYDEIQSFFDGTPFSEEDFSPPLRVSLSLMKSLAQKMIEQRQKRGSLDFDLPETEVIYNNAGVITSIHKAKRFFSHRLIEELMISANRAVAELFTFLQVPFLYRIHDPPDSEKIEQFKLSLHNLGIGSRIPPLNRPKDYSLVLDLLKQHPMEMFLHQVLLRSMKIAFYSADNKGHFGLNLKDYCHFTSPIRRYPDLIVHRQLKLLLKESANGKIHLILNKERNTHLNSKTGDRGGPARKRSTSVYTADQIVYLGDISSKRERQAFEAEREMLDYKRAQFMMEHIGNKFFGTIRRIVKFGLFVELEPHFVEGLLHVTELKDDYYLYDEKRFRFIGKKKKNKSYRIGDKIWVIVKDVSIVNRSILLAISD